MRNLLALIALLVIAFVSVGVWRGWYAVTRQTADPGKFAFRVEIDAIRVTADFTELVQYLSQKADRKSPESVIP